MELERVQGLPRLPARAEASHKGNFGRVLIVAGSRGMAGAAALVGMAALRGGAGLVKVACPREVQPTVAGFHPAYMTLPLADGPDGCLCYAENREYLEYEMAGSDVVAVGPGLGRGGAIPGLVSWLLSRATCPVVLDADGINAMEGRAELLFMGPGPRIVTPHPGEFTRLTRRQLSADPAEREAAAVALAGPGKGRLIVLLKGAATVITDGIRVAENRTGNPGMATGGSGDVLTGVIAALVGQGLSPLDAAVLGAHVHGLAGDLACAERGEVGMVATDLLDSLPGAFLRLATEPSAPRGLAVPARVE